MDPGALRSHLPQEEASSPSVSGRGTPQPICQFLVRKAAPGLMSNGSRVAQNGIWALAPTRARTSSNAHVTCTAHGPAVTFISDDGRASERSARCKALSTDAHTRAPTPTPGTHL